jgi:thioredoxin 1
LNEKMRSLSSGQWSAHNGGAPFTLADFCRSLPSPLICIKFGAKWCGPCKQVAPLYQALAQQAAAVGVACFEVDVEESEDIAVAANVQNLPTFVFYTTKLSATGELDQLDRVVGVNEAELKDKFAKCIQVAQAVAQQIQAAQPPVAPQLPQQPQQPQQQLPQQTQLLQGQQYVAPQPPPQGQAPQGQQQHVAQPASQQQAQGPPTGPNQVVKKELLEIRASLVLALQRVERLYSALQ